MARRESSYIENEVPEREAFSVPLQRGVGIRDREESLNEKAALIEAAREGVAMPTKERVVPESCVVAAAGLIESTREVQAQNIENGDGV